MIVRIKSSTCRQLDRRCNSGTTTHQRTTISFGKECLCYIGMQLVEIDFRSMQISRPSVFSSSALRLRGRVNLKYSPEFDGEYNLTKIDEDIFRLDPIKK